jgi:hypothetical protein
MEIKLDGTLTKDEFLQAAKLGNHPVTKNLHFRIELWLLLLLAGLVIIGLGIGGMIVNLDYYPIELVSTIFGAVLVVIGVKIRNAVAQVWDKNETLRAHCEGLVTDDFIEMRTPTSESRLQWSELSGYGEFHEVIVLFRGTTLAIPFSKRFFQGESEWLQFKTLVAGKLARTHRINPVSWANFLIWIIIAVSAIIFGFKLIESSK